MKCRLPWTWSWLQATLELKYPTNKHKYSEVQQLIDGHFKVIQYHLDPSQGANGTSAICLFLTDVCSSCGGDGGRGGGEEVVEYKTQLGVWLSHLPSSKVSLDKIEELLTQYEEENISRRSIQTSLFRQCMNSSIAGQVYFLAVNHPTFFRAAPILFPRKIASLMITPDDSTPEKIKKQKLHESLEDITKEEPWKFGFSDIMYKETKFSGLEAPLFLLRSAWFYPSLSDLHKTALMTYDLFKSTCKSRGHTYLLHNDMPTHFKYYVKERSNRDDTVEAPGSNDS